MKKKVFMMTKLVKSKELYWGDKVISIILVQKCTNIVYPKIDKISAF